MESEAGTSFSVPTLYHKVSGVRKMKVGEVFHLDTPADLRYTGRKAHWKGVISMDFLGKVGDTISAKGREAVDKAKVLAEIASLRSQIATCEEVIKKNYQEIGRQYFEEYNDVPDAPFEKQCEAVRNAKNGMRQLQERIDALKGF